MCHFELSKESLNIAYLIDFDSYFATELENCANTSARACWKFPAMDQRHAQGTHADTQHLHGVRQVSAHPYRTCALFEGDLKQQIQP